MSRVNHKVMDILAAGFLAFLAGFLGYLGELYTKELCLKALKRYTKKGD